MPFKWTRKWNLLGDGPWREVRCVAQGACPGCAKMWHSTGWFGPGESDKILKFLQEHSVAGDPPPLAVLEAEFPEAFEDYLVRRLS